MKKIIALLAAMVFSTQIYAALPNDVSEFAVSAPLYRGNIEFGANFYYLRFSTPDLIYALTFPTVLLEEGEFRRATPQFDYGYDINIGYRFPCSSKDLKLIYRWYREGDKRLVTTIDGVIIPLVFTTTVQRTATVSSASVRNSVKQHAVDLEFGQHLLIDTMATLRWSLGVRTATIENDFNVIYFFNATETRPILQQAVDQESDFTGFGPRFGIDGSFHLGAGIGLVGHLSSAFLVGHHRANLSSIFRGSPPLPSPETFSVKSPSEVHIVPNIEAKIALDVGHQFCNCWIFTFEIGYFVSRYFNVVTRLSGFSSDESEFPVPEKHVEDASFSGPYIGVQVVL